MCFVCDIEEATRQGNWPGVIALALAEMQMDEAPSELLQPVMTAMGPLTNWHSEQEAATADD